jgi:hypothetical protein
MKKSSGRKVNWAYMRTEIYKEVQSFILRGKFATVIMIKSRIAMLLPLTLCQIASAQCDDRTNSGLTIQSETTISRTFVTFR